MSKTGLVAVSTAIALVLALIAWRLDSPLEGERPNAQTASREAGATAARSATAAASPAAAEGGELRRRLDHEIRARRELERRLEALEREVAGLASASQRGPAAKADSVAVDAESEAASADGSRGAWFDEQALIASGIDEARARELKLYFEQLELERLRLRDRAAREGWDGSRRRQEFALLGEREDALREQLGEDEYAAYLYAAGRPNSVEISSVLASAPAGQAGIRPGDRILRYAGERIYSPRELRVATTGGEFGDPVEIEVERDGETLRFYLARGPMGVRTGPLSVAP